MTLKVLLLPWMYEGRYYNTELHFFVAITSWIKHPPKSSQPTTQTWMCRGQVWQRVCDNALSKHHCKAEFCIPVSIDIVWEEIIASRGSTTHPHGSIICNYPSIHLPMPRVSMLKPVFIHIPQDLTGSIQIDPAFSFYTDSTRSD